MNLPKRLPVGKGYQGPDYYGCCNTGHAPVILNSRELAEWSALNPRGYRFAVGDSLWVDDAVMAMLRGKVAGATWEHGTMATVRFFKTYKAAQKYFAERCEKIKAMNREMRESE